MKNIWLLWFCACLGILAGETRTFSKLKVELASPKNLLTEKLVRGTKAPAGVTVEYRDEKAHYLIQGASRGVKYRLPLANMPEGYAVLITFRRRLENVVLGDAFWKDARIDLFFQDAQGKRMNPHLKTFAGVGSIPWEECTRLYYPYEGAKYLEIYPVNYGASGTLEIEGLFVQFAKEQLDMDSPDGRSVAEVFSLDDAWKRETPTRRQISLNGLWQFHLLKDDDPREVPPAVGTGWGWQKVPGTWRSDSRHCREQENPTPAHLAERIAAEIPNPHWAWYRRRITVPHEWAGTKILLQLDAVNAAAEVRIDRKKVGDIEFPCGELDLTPVANPGKEILVEMLVQAMPMEQQSAAGATRIYKDMGELSNKGLCGEARLESVPLNGPRITDVHVRTYVAKKCIDFNTGFLGLPKGEYQLSAVVRGPDNFEKQFPPQKIVSDGAAESRHGAAYDWIAPKLWDIDCPDNLYTAQVTLADASGKVLDVFYPEEFGFREFTIEGRNFCLNGTIIHLRSLPSQTGANSAYAHKDSVTELVRRCKAIGVNFLIDGDRTYSVLPGKFGYQDDYRGITSRLGLLTSLTMPNYRICTDLDSNPESQKKFRKLAEQRLRRYQNLPGLVLQSTSHNSVGYPDFSNPLRLANGYSPEKFGMNRLNRKQALVAANILKEIDPTRPVYHHSGGMLGDIQANNEYENWAPAQERADWLSYWEKNGTAPLMFVKYGMPHIASWSSYRGPLFIWRAAAVQVFWLDEFDAETLGEESYRMDDAKRDYFSRKHIVAKQFENKERRYGHFTSPGLDLTRSLYACKTFRNMNARGISMCLPWDGSTFHRRVSKGLPATKPNPNAFKNLKQPGLVPDYFTSSGGYLEDAINEYELTLTGKAFTECLTDPLQAWIGGAPGNFTDSSLNYVEHEDVRKSLILVNHTRHPQTFRYQWRVCGWHGAQGTVTVAPGTREEIEIRGQARSQKNEITADVTCEFEKGKPPRTWHDSIRLNVFPRSIQAKVSSKIGCYDSSKQHRQIKRGGEWLSSTCSLLERKLSLKNVTEVRTQKDLQGVQILVLGPDAFSEKLPFQLADAMRNGLKVLVLAQNEKSLLRMGLRPNVQGLRELFPIDNAFPNKLSYWRGASSSLPPFWELPDISPAPPYSWCGFEVKHTWRAGNRGIVSHILPEKPSKGNWLPLYQGGFDLQYAPLLYFTEGKVQILLCQLEVFNRVEVDSQLQPNDLVDDQQALETLAKAIEFLDQAKPVETHRVWRVGADALAAQLTASGIVSSPLDSSQVKPGDVIVLTRGADIPANLRALVESGVNVLCCGMTAAELEKVAGVKTVHGTYFTDYVENLRAEPLFRGIGNSELHVRYPQEFDGFPEGSAGGVSLNCVRIGKGAIVMMQLPPWTWDRQFFAVRTTCRRADFTLMRLLANLGATFQTNFCERFAACNVEESPTDVANGWQICFDPDNKGLEEKWAQNPLRAKGWRPVKTGVYWEDQFKEYSQYDGIAWFRLNFKLTSSDQFNGNAVLSLGAIDDESWIYLNGHLVSEITAKTHPNNYWSEPRIIPLNPKYLNPSGQQTILIRCNDIKGYGGMPGTPQLQIGAEHSLYVDTPVQSDDPYRFYHW
ncbi:MAG: hypothetical protein IJJ26_14065 [Victivallales bacterium]|nr:hypothetical protein [Victivallales bacterium]